LNGFTIASTNFIKVLLVICCKKLRLNFWLSMSKRNAIVAICTERDKEGLK